MVLLFLLFLFFLGLVFSFSEMYPVANPDVNNGGGGGISSKLLRTYTHILWNAAYMINNRNERQLTVFYYLNFLNGCSKMDFF